jgi:hypothetical protein
LVTGVAELTSFVATLVYDRDDEPTEAQKFQPGPSASDLCKAVHVGTETVDVYWDRAEPDELAAQATSDALQELDVEIEKEKAKGWSPEDFKKYGRTAATGLKPNGEDVDWFRRIGIPNSITAYIDWRLANSNLVLAEVPGFGPAIEVPFNYYIGDQLIHGWIDRIFTDTEIGGYYPLDLKSGAKPKTDEQLGLYAAALKKALGWHIDWGYYLYGLKTGTAKLTAPLKVSHWNDDKLGQIYLPATQLIDLGIFIPNPGEHCWMLCSVSDHCQFMQSVV